jgi:hypothetical protein
MAMFWVQQLLTLAQARSLCTTVKRKHRSISPWTVAVGQNTRLLGTAPQSLAASRCSGAHIIVPPTPKPKRPKMTTTVSQANPQALDCSEAASALTENCDYPLPKVSASPLLLCRWEKVLEPSSPRTCADLASVLTPNTSAKRFLGAVADPLIRNNPRITPLLQRTTSVPRATMTRLLCQFQSQRLSSRTAEPSLSTNLWQGTSTSSEHSPMPVL